MFKLHQGIFFATSLIILPQGLWAQNSTSQLQEEQANSRREIMQRYMEVSRKVNAEPEVANLRSIAEKTRKSYQEAFETAMRKEDPKILKQFRSIQDGTLERYKSRYRHKGGPIDRPASSSYSRLTEAEKKQLDAARREATKSRVVKEARQRRNEAKDEDERVKAVVAYKEALNKAMIEADEEMENLLKKLEEAK